MDSESKQETEQDAILNLRRKLNALENERLNVISSSNEEISRLLSEVARLTAHLERGEALRQNLEYELARSKKDVLIEQNAAEHHHSQMKKLIEECTRKEEKNISEKKTLTKELEAIRAATQEDISRFANLMQEKEKQVLVLLKEKDCLNAEKSKLTLTIMDRESTINQYKAELDRFAAHGRLKESNLWSKVEQLKEQVNVLEQELLLTLTKVESLEAANEVEKKNHLETKCSCDVLQNEVKTESAAKADALLKVEKIQDQLRQNQESLEEEKASSSKLQEKLAHLEEEFENVKKQLSSELADKKRLVKSYSQQLEECQKTAIQLRQELSKAKKRQMQLDEAYSSGLKQLQEVIAVSGNSLSPSSSATVKPTTTDLAKEAARANNFCNMVSSIQQIFYDRLQQQDRLSRDLSSHQQMVEQLTRECKSYKLTMSTSAKACQMSNEALEKARCEKNQIETQLVSLKEECSLLHRDLSRLKTSLAKEKSFSQELQAQMVKLTKRYQNDEQRSSTFVLLLHQLLNTVDSVAAISGKCSTSKEGALPRWNDLGLVVNEQVSGLVNLLNQEKEKVSRMEEILRKKERMLEQHNEELTKIAKTYASANQQWTGEKEEIQKKFIKKLSAVHSKLKISAEETWQKMETANVYQQELEQDREKLLGQLNTCRIESSALLATCALLCGTVYPLHARYVALLEQRGALNNQLAHFESFKTQVGNLIFAISGERSDPDPRMSVARISNLAPRLRFRATVIAVIAVRRLLGFGDNSCRIFTSFNSLPGVYATAVCVGGTTSVPKGSGESFDAGSVDRLSDWLSSADLHSAIHSSMHDLVTATDRIRERASGYECTQLLNIAKNCFQKFLSFLPKIFPLISVDRGSHSFCTDLGKGLESCLGSCLNISHMSYVNSQQLAKSLQQELLNFTRRLHVSELERRDLRAALSLIERGVVGKEQKELTDQFTAAVPVDKFREVCGELARALEREEQLQGVLAIQKEQLEGQAERLYTFNDNGVRHENLAASGGRQLSDLRVELNSKDLLVQRLTRQIAIIDEEKASLLSNVSDAEIALQTAAEEKRSVICYVNTLSNWFKQMPSAKNGKWDIEALLDFELSDAKSCAQLSAVRSLLVAFIETLNSLFESQSFGCDSCSFRKQPNGNMNRKFHPEMRFSKNRDSFRPFVVDSDPGPLMVRLNVKESKNSQKRVTDKKPKSKLPRHQGLRALTHRVMSSHRAMSSSQTGAESINLSAARNSSKLIS